MGIEIRSMNFLIVHRIEKILIHLGFNTRPTPCMTDIFSSFPIPSTL